MGNRGRWLGAVIGAAIGAGLGYTWTLLSEREKHAFEGGVGGVMFGLVAAEFVIRRKHVALKTLKAKLPGAEVEIDFSLNEAQRHAAWTIFVELATRIATQPLADDEGGIREAMNSLYGLFQTIRTTLEAMPPSREARGGSVELFAIRLLNHGLRPVLGRWHPRLAAWEKQDPPRTEDEWPDAAACRAEIATTRERLGKYALELARLAEVHRAVQILESPR